MKIERIRPEEIERRSFEIITDLLGSSSCRMKQLTL